VRMIFAGQSSDECGLDAMTQLIAANPSGSDPDGVHFLLPLPVSPEALDLFGFWTYEFRVGHSKRWSTCQGRYGRPLKVTGIQHPAPHLTCTVQRNKDQVYVTAPYATTVFNGRRVYDLRRGDPQTALWFLLYAQVTQTDGASYRNVLLGHKEGQILRDIILPEQVPALVAETPVFGEHTVNREPRGYTIFYSANEINAYLMTLGLPLTSSLSVLAVEVLPGPFSFRTFRGGDGRGNAPGDTAGAAVSGEDPLGSQLGARRILRTSPLTPVPAIC